MESTDGNHTPAGSTGGDRAETAEASGSTSGGGGVLHRLYTGTGAFDIIGKRKRWYIALGLLVVVCLGSIGIKGFNLGIEFVGGTKISMPAEGARGAISADDAEKAFREALGKPADSVQVVGSGDSRSVQIRTDKLSVDDLAKVKQGMFADLQPLGANGQPTRNALSDSAVSGTWGSEITEQALIALAVFLVLVTAFLAFYFERWMAVGALVALLHDVVVTAGLYSLIGFEVSPSTVIGLLTILGFSLYDTVVVFDKVRENTRGLLSMNRRTYPEAANLAINQTLMRSINTSVVALLPVLGLLIVGAGILGVGVLRDLALVQGVGMLAGVVSSVYLATPLLVDLKMRERKFREHETKVLNKRAKKAGGETADVAVEATAPEAGREREMAAAASSAARTGKGAESRRGTARPSGKSDRPSGKRRR